MRKMWIIALIWLCEALAEETSSCVTKSETTTPNTTEDVTTTPIFLMEEGNDAKDGQFPWAVALHINGTYTCTATILSERIVLTAAHCVSKDKNAKNLVGHAGSANKSANKSPANRIEFEKIHIHPNYSDSDNDIAVLKTKESIIFKKNVNKTCIAGEKTKGRGYQNLTAIGWGKLGKNSEAEGSNVLQYQDMEFLDNHECFHNSTLKQSHICARTIKGAICSGDSGGSLVQYNRKKEAVLMGVTSRGFSERCGSKATFARVSHYNDFIVQAAGKGHGICII